MLNSKYKTERCRNKCQNGIFIKELICPYGDKCIFAHTDDELDKYNNTLNNKNVKNLKINSTLIVNNDDFPYLNSPKTPKLIINANERTLLFKDIVKSEIDKENKKNILHIIVSFISRFSSGSESCL